MSATITDTMVETAWRAFALHDGFSSFTIAGNLRYLRAMRAALTAVLSVAEPDYKGSFLSAAAAHRNSEARCAELGSELDRLREATQAVVDAEGPGQRDRVAFWAAVDALRAALESDGAPGCEHQRVTHGRHCTCSACAREDWTNPGLAPCGMHGEECPAMYQPWGLAGMVIPVAPAHIAASDGAPAEETR